MIQHVNILTTNGKSILFREYGSTKIDRDLLAGFLSAFSGFMMEISQSEIKSTVTENAKFIYNMQQNIIVVICTDINDTEDEIFPKLEEIQNKFLDRYVDIINSGEWTGERNYFNDFIPTIDDIVLGPIKISILGYASVGKTTITQLIVGKDVNLEYVPTITADIARFDQLGTREVVLWDFAGQIQYTTLWNSLLRGTKIVLLVTNSTYQNVLATKKILDEYISKNKDEIKVIGIANKQDLPNRLTPHFVEKILKVPTYSMVAINPDFRIVILEILRDLIDEINIEDGLVKELEKNI